jgi:leader peptidase (prepilin peptidase) / N-methyltransferase
MLCAAVVSPPVLVALLFLAGTIVGTLVNLWGIRLAYDHPAGGGDPGTTSPNRTQTVAPREASRWWELAPLVGYFLSRAQGRYRGHALGASGLLAELGTGFLFAAFGTAYLVFRCQDVSEVRPDDVWWYARLVYHLLLVTFLVAATATDLRDYVIPDEITRPGTAIGILAAFASGQLQIIHLWVDWSQEIPGIRGPYIPDWLDPHRHLHGLAWSLAGAAVGGGITFLVLVVSRWMLGRDAMGFGDVTLMAMIGSYIGWQPVLCVFFLAPLTGLASAIGAYIFAKRAILPYGPCLGAAAFAVICTWKWLWVRMRYAFGDWQLLAILSVAAFIAFVLLLGAIRFIQSRSLSTDHFDDA